jgi:3D (Asp-Asp-Asp) domain-containing protein
MTQTRINRLRRVRRARMAQNAAEIAAFALLAGLTTISAVLAKRQAPGPALVAVDEAPLNFVLGTNADAPAAESLPGFSAIPAVSPAPNPAAAAPAPAMQGLRIEVESDVREPALLPTIISEPQVSPSRPEPIYTPAEGAVRYFDGRPIRPARTITMVVTAYSPDARSCPGTDDGVTATNHSVWTNAMRLVAADTDLLPFGSLVSIPGYAEGEVVPVLDRGGAIKGRRLDVLYPTHDIARKWGRQRLKVTVWEYADGKGSSPRGAKRRG